MSNDIHLGAITQEIPQPSITKFNLEITPLNFLSKLQGDNESDLLTY